MIKIEPLFATDYVQMRALLRLDAEHRPAEDICTENTFIFRGLTFWQHWLPCQLHAAPSVYVAKEDGVVLGLISLRSFGKSKECWQVGHLIVHPLHRGRGVAQELLRYAFALLGSQGVSHFLSEVPDLNQAALSLFAACGFSRSTKLNRYLLELKPSKNESKGSEVSQPCPFQLAGPADKLALYQLHQDMLPPNIRVIFSYCPDDFAGFELPFENAEKMRKQIAKPKSWFWIAADAERKVLTGAVKVTSHAPSDYHLEFAIHPGWQHLSEDFVKAAVAEIAKVCPFATISAKAYEFQPNLGDILESAGFNRTDTFFVLTREHWVRAKQPKLLDKEGGQILPGIAKPAINLPLIMDRSIFDDNN
jgi:ribosomal protein S18 acetylase RimI-like enzyme